MSIGKISRVPLREVWKHEAYDFTKWLSENIDVLSEVIEPTLSEVESEQPAGSFSVDLVAEDDQGNPVVIENQLGKSDHDHLGKLLTYLAAFEAKTAIWIVGEPRPEHTSAVAWLNESSPANFYLIKAEAVKINNSEPALLLTKIVGPSEAGKAVASEKQEGEERHKLRKAFFTGLLDTAQTKTSLHKSISPGTASYVAASAGRSGLIYSYVVLQQSWRVEVYIDTTDQDINESIFDQLISDKQAIESDFGTELDWQKLEAKRACRIACHGDTGGWRSHQDDWPSIFATMIDKMIRLDNAMRKKIAAVDTTLPTDPSTAATEVARVIPAH